MSKIFKVQARQVFDSRGNPTVEAEIVLDNKIKTSAIVPSGASTGMPILFMASPLVPCRLHSACAGRKQPCAGVFEECVAPGLKKLKKKVQVSTGLHTVFIDFVAFPRSS